MEASKTTNLAATADVKAFGGSATVWKITIAGASISPAGWIELRNATSPPGNSGTLIWRQRQVAASNVGVNVNFPKGLHMPQGIRLVIGATGAEVTVQWSG